MMFLHFYQTGHLTFTFYEVNALTSPEDMPASLREAVDHLRGGPSICLRGSDTAES